MSISDIDEVATLHRTIFKNTLFSKYGTRILWLYYHEVANSQHTFAYVCRQGTKIVGVIVGSIDLPKFRCGFILRRGVKVLCVLLTQPLTVLRSTSNILNSLSLLPSRHHERLPKECLLTIFVDSMKPTTGVATDLLRCLEREMASRKVTRFLVQTEHSNVRAASFYSKNGFTPVDVSTRQKVFIREL